MIFIVLILFQKITIKTFSDIKSNENEHDYGLVWTKVDKTPIDYDENNETNLKYFQTVDGGFTNLQNTMITFITELKEKAKNKGDTQPKASTTAELNDKITFTKQEIIDIGFANYVDYINIIKRYSYAHLPDTDGIIFRYVPTYIGYTKDSLRINKYTWDIINNVDFELPDKLKYVYNSGGAKEDSTNRVYNYQIQKEEINTLKYYDCIYIKTEYSCKLFSKSVLYIDLINKSYLEQVVDQMIQIHWFLIQYCLN